MQRVQRIDRMSVWGSRVDRTWVGAEVEEKAQINIGRAEVIVELALGCSGQFKGRFGFDDQLFVDNHVEPLMGDLMSFVHHRNWYFPADGVAALQQLTLE